MKVFLDFDDVLFDTRRFREGLLNIFVRVGIPADIFFQTYERVKMAQEGMQTYDYEKHVQALKEKVSFDEGVLRDSVEKFLADCGRYMFSDTMTFIRSLKKSGFELILISFGTADFQGKKVDGSGIKNFLDGSCVGNIHKGREVQKLLPEKGVFWFLDDRVDHIEGVKRENPHVKTILVTRPEGRFTDLKNEWCDFEVKNLREAERVICGSVY